MEESILCSGTAFALVESRVQDAIALTGAPLPVGHCLVVETGDFGVPFLLCAPTMRFPSNVAHTDHAYQAMRAILAKASEHGLESVAVPGLCTGIGSMHYDTAAEQMAEAYREFKSKD
ncbi:MAG TPA: macro domain-containing protein [Fimbriimonadaceae bacterium]|nr:macro domain-containing protein [Fimbriimonadaceae bacterium]